MKYDCFISLGETCATASVLHDNRLRMGSFPFDWITGPLINERIGILNNRFVDFLSKSENLEQFFCDADKHFNNPHYRYVDTITGIKMHHDFDKQISFDENFFAVKEKYWRRINRLLSLLSQKNKILLVWIKKEDEVDFNKVQESLIKLNKNFRADIDLICFCDDKNLSMTQYLKEDLIFENIKIMKYSINNEPTCKDSALEIIKGNQILISKILKKHKKSVIFNFQDIKNKLRYKIWKHLDKKLRRKGIIQ